MNSSTNDLSLKLVYVAILAGLVLAFTSPTHLGGSHAPPSDAAAAASR